MATNTTTSTAPAGPVPKDYLPGLLQNAKFDVMSGFILFLIALPLSLAIALASGVPAIAGVLTAIVGGIIGGLLGGSYITINGPAAGLIVIVLGCMTEMTALTGGDAMAAYKYTLAIGVMVGLIQIGLGLAKAGPMANVFPFSVVEGMVAGIGIIIMLKQIHVALGVTVTGNMFETAAAIPSSVINMNPKVALIGGIAIALMIFWPKIAGALAKFLPAPLVIMATTIPLGIYFGLEKNQLVSVPLNFMESFTFPDFGKIADPVSIKWIITFVLVASLESLLTAAAIEKKDPWKRRNNMNREFWSKGVANTSTSLIGGIPMIAEVVRSSTNIMVGARTRWSNVFHGFFMLVFVALLPWLLNLIPLAALAGMLTVIGFRLAHPSIFAHILHTGKDEFAFMVATVLGVVLIDLLVGVYIGMWVSIAMNAVRAGNANRFGSSTFFLALHFAFIATAGYFFFIAHSKLAAIVVMMVNVAVGILSFKTVLKIEESGDQVKVSFSGPAVFTSLIGVRNALDRLPGGKKVTLDMSNAGLIDHTVREKLKDISEEYARDTGGTVTVTGTQNHKPTCHHELATLVRA